MATRKSQQNSHASVIDGYEPLDVIGQGTFGLIRKVRRKSDAMLFARKELNFERMSERDRKQIVAEVNILRTLNHENVVKYEERYVDSENGILYIVMEYCEGGDLGSVIKKCRKTNTLLPEDTVWSYLSQMTLALDVCHYRGGSTASSRSSAARAGSSSSDSTQATAANAIIHRDLKPDNVFLDSDQNIKLGDFGLSKQIAAQAFANTYVGTPYYMSPELATGKMYDFKSDIWALGCIVFELCALNPPFDATTQAELTHKIKLGQIPALPRQYSSELGEVVNAMLQLDPKRRPTTKQLLNFSQIKFACRTLELSKMHRTLTQEKAKLDAREATLNAKELELEGREAALVAAETDLEKSPGHLEFLERVRELEEAEGRLMAAEEELKKREKSTDALRQTFSDQWDKWYNGERAELQELCDAKTKQIAELEARIGQLGEGVVDPDSSTGNLSLRTKIPRSSDPHSFRRGLAMAKAEAALFGGLPSSRSGHNIASASSRITRPVARRNVSGGKSRLSMGDGDVSMLSIRERLANGTTGLGTPRSVRQRELERQGRQHQENLADSPAKGGTSMGSPSEHSDEWVEEESNSRRSSPDQEKVEDAVHARSDEASVALMSEDTLDSPSVRRYGRSRSSRASEAASRFSSSRAIDSSPRAMVRSSPAPRSTYQSRAWRERPDDSDIPMLSFHDGESSLANYNETFSDGLAPPSSSSNDNNNSGRGGGGEGSSSDGIVGNMAKVDLGSERSGHRALRSSGSSRSQEASAAVAPSSSSGSSRPNFRMRNTAPAIPSTSAEAETNALQAQAHSVPAPTQLSTGQQQPQQDLPADPKWLQNHDEEEIPSPFLKRVSRIPNERLSKHISGGGGGGAHSLLKKATMGAVSEAQAQAQTSRAERRLQREATNAVVAGNVEAGGRTEKENHRASALRLVPSISTLGGDKGVIPGSRCHTRKSLINGGGGGSASGGCQPLVSSVLSINNGGAPPPPPPAGNRVITGGGSSARPRLSALPPIQVAPLNPKRHSLVPSAAPSVVNYARRDPVV